MAGALSKELQMRTTPTHATHTSLRAGILGLMLLGAAGTAQPAFAGPPLLCHPFDIGASASLPWNDGTGSWYEGKSGYDLQRLAGDTEALLTPSTPVIARMETLRRAAIYASRDPQVAKRLFLTMHDRIRAAAAASGGKTDPLTLFDAGYLTETFREIARLAARNVSVGQMDALAMAAIVKDVDGYALVKKSLALRPGDASIELASALIAASDPVRKADYAQHAANARAGAKQDALLGKNLTQISN
jgi:hypothetical protein